MKYQIISTGSHGNAVLYHNYILVDCGVSFKALKPHLKQLQVVLLTHEHRDHINVNTLVKLQFERPSLRIACCEWMVPLVTGLRNIDVLKVGEVYDYGTFKVSPIKLYHDVENCGYRIIKDGFKLIHMTDTAHVRGIEAKDYDLYAIEHNYDEESVEKSIAISKSKGEFNHQVYSINSHLSEQQAREFIYNNCGEKYEVLRLHESSI